MSNKRKSEEKDTIAKRLKVLIQGQTKQFDKNWTMILEHYRSDLYLSAAKGAFQCTAIYKHTDNTSLQTAIENWSDYEERKSHTDIYMHKKINKNNHLTLVFNWHLYVTGCSEERQTDGAILYRLAKSNFDLGLRTAMSCVEKYCAAHIKNNSDSRYEDQTHINIDSYAKQNECFGEYIAYYGTFKQQLIEKLALEGIEIINNKITIN